MQQVNMTPVNYNPNITLPQQPQQQQAVKIIQQSDNNQNLQGADALANYNKPLVQQAQTAQSPLRTLHPTAPSKITKEMLSSMPGEKIYDSNGDLHSFVQKTPETTVTYKIQENIINSITTIDNKTGLRLKEEIIFPETLSDEDGKPSKNLKPTYVLIDEFYPNSDKCMRSTYYDKDGTLKNVSENEYAAPDYRKCSAYNKGEYTIQEYSKQGNFFNKTTYKDGQIKEVETADYEHKNWQVTTYENGAPKETKSHTKKTIIQDAEAMKILGDSSLKPSAPFVINYDPMQLQGERKYYSNGALEKIDAEANGAEFSYRYSPEGKLTSVEENQPANDYTKTVIYLDKAYSIDEDLPGGKMHKSTTYAQDGSYYVAIRDEEKNLLRSVDYDEKGRMRTYLEDKLDSTCSRNPSLIVEFDEQGNIINLEKGEKA